MIATVHIAEVSRSTGMRLLRTRLDPKEVQGLRYARVTMLAPLSSHLLPKPSLGRRVGLIAGWEDDLAVEEFLADHPLAAQLAEGWQVRLQPTRIFGAWPPLPDLLDQERPMDEGEPAAVLTIGRLRNSQGPRFLRASAAAEGLALRDPGLLASTGMARPPEFVATFSLWRTVGAMRAYAQGHSEPGHLAAIKAHAHKPFHHDSAFVRFRPYASKGLWDGVDPLAGLGSMGTQAGEEIPVTSEVRD
jgi:hypothetical protein